MESPCRGLPDEGLGGHMVLGIMVDTHKPPILLPPTLWSHCYPPKGQAGCAQCLWGLRKHSEAIGRPFNRTSIFPPEWKYCLKKGLLKASECFWRSCEHGMRLQQHGGACSRRGSSLHTVCVCGTLQIWFWAAHGPGM